MQQSELISANHFKITTAETDIEQRLRLGALVNLLIQSAVNSADSLGFGFKDINNQNLSWVLSRLTVTISKPIKWYDHIIVETWPKDIDKILYLRDFIIRTSEGIELAKATSGWLAIDMSRRRPTIVKGSAEEIFSKLRNKHAIEHLPEKLNGFNAGNKFSYKAQYSDIDLNRHVTATRYIDWMMDSLDITYLQKNYPKQLVINYLKETMPNETITILQHQDNNNFCFEGENSSNNTKAFRGLIKF